VGRQFLTGNITLYPKTLFADTGRFARLSASQQQVPRSAAQRTPAFASAPRWSQVPGSVPAAVVTGQPTVDAIQRAARPVYAHLEQDPQAKAFIGQIQQMKQRFPAPSGGRLPIPGAPIRRRPDACRPR
jgi:hypothetical protein